jgi:hypothetical protein
VGRAAESLLTPFIIRRIVEDDGPAILTLALGCFRLFSQSVRSAVAGAEFPPDGELFRDCSREREGLAVSRMEEHLVRRTFSDTRESEPRLSDEQSLRRGRKSNRLVLPSNLGQTNRQLKGKKRKRISGAEIMEADP